jgi:hypothetical protein
MKPFGNMPGRTVFWQSEDRRTEIIRYCHGVFGLEHEGRTVMPETTFEVVTRYVHAEFLTL